MVYQILLGERTIEIHSLYKQSFDMCKDYLITEFVSSPDIVIRITPEDIIQEAKRYQLNNYIHVKESQLEWRTLLRKVADSIFKFDTLLIHGVAICTDGQGYLIVAPSGVGKTTRAKIWLDSIPDSFIINGDKPLVRIEKTDAKAYGTPWCGKEHWSKNVGIPLKSIFFLNRAHDKSIIRKIGFSEATVKLLKQIYLTNDGNDLYNVIMLLKKLDGKIGFYDFYSTPTEDSVKMAFNVARLI